VAAPRFARGASTL